jgi:hypothetical protein
VIVVGCVVLICITVLWYQHAGHEHARAMQGEARLLHQLETRLVALERARRDEFDPKAFDDLKAKVEAMRVAQGLRGSR